MNHVISVWGPSGGCGKTLLSMLLADCLESKGIKTCVYDLSEYKNSMFLSAKGNFKTTVVSSAKDLPPDTQITIVDHQGYSEEDSCLESVKPSLLIIPVKPNLLQISDLSKFIKSKTTDVEILPVFNMCDFSRKENIKIINNYPDFSRVKNRGVFERMANTQCSIFNKEADSWASIALARKDIEEFTDKVLKHLK